jgi:N-acetyl-gamma-glutamyl-phosphate reductase
MGVPVAVAGASGYAGGELLRLLADHPSLDVQSVTAQTTVGRPVTELHPNLISYAGQRFVETTPEQLARAELVFLALPHGKSADLVAQLPAETKVVDLGADFRLRDGQAWRRAYGMPHRGSWTYGLPELPGQRAVIAASDRVANTGCYAVAVITALAPLIAAGCVQPSDVVVVAASGTSGAGRLLKDHLLASQAMTDLSPYKVGCHQHVPEILQATGAETLSMTPVMAPMPRGILATVTALPSRSGITTTEIREVLAGAYAGEPFIRLLDEGQQPHSGATLGSNSVHLQAAVDQSSGRVIVVSAIDNLGKGAAGQAIQNANLMLGLDEAAGLSANGIAP